jgi:hypothetical protein
MNNKYFRLLPIFLLAAGTLVSKETADVDFVRDGRAQGVIVIGENAPARIVELAEYFSKTVERSTGAALPVVPETKEGGLPAEQPRLYLGATKRGSAEGLTIASLADEEYRIQTRGRDVFVLGKDVEAKAGNEEKWSRETMPEPTRWALNDLLEKQLGVRWLWPGDLGTFVPRQKDFTIPSQDTRRQPALLVRELALGTLSYDLVSPDERRLATEARDWAANHQANKRNATPRSSFPLGHGFSHWWKKYGADHPEFFVETPPGKTPPRDLYIKPRFSNPAVIEQIAKEYAEAGAPRYWNVGEQDGYRFDVSDIARSWDLPPNPSVDDVWDGKVNLTPRYVHIWNLIYDRLKQINPDVVLTAMAYSAYRQPPPKERQLHAKMLIGMVVSYNAYDEWKGWRDASMGGEMFLRPNWGWVGANAPHLPLQEIQSYMKFAAENGMIGFRLDSVVGFWGTQGPTYYLIARMLARPDLSLDDILSEYASAFGAGAPKIREYLDYWQKRSDEYAFTISGDERPGKYMELVRGGKIPGSGALAPRQALVHLYTDEVLQPAYALLDEAEHLIGDPGSEQARRVAFLRTGLDEMKLTRDLVAMAGQVNAKSDPSAIREFRQRSRDLDTLRQQLSANHVIWGKGVRLLEDRYPLPIRPENMNLPEVEQGND